MTKRREQGFTGGYFGGQMRMLGRFSLGLLMMALLYTGAQPSYGSNSGVRTGELHELTTTQQKSVAEFIHEHEQPNGELTIMADRSKITVNSSKALLDLLPAYRFVLIPWIYSPTTPEAAHKFQIPGPDAAASSLALSDDGKRRIELDGNGEEWGKLIHAERVSIRTKAMADKVAAAFFPECYQGASCRNIRQGDSEWRLGYREQPFRPISSYEEIREAYYYRVIIDPSGFVLSGRLVNEVIERRKLATGTAPPAPH
jgi:hypothetical protein